MTTSASISYRSDSAAAQLRGEILNGTMPPGTLLAESAVAEQLGVSRVPVREALFTLEREGLVEFSATGRAFVKQLTPRDFEELYLLRLALEPLAARLAAPVFRSSCQGLKQNLTAIRRAKSLREVTRLDLEFHELIVTASGNSRLLKLWSSLRGELELWLGRLHRDHQRLTQTTRKETLEAHQAIIDGFQNQSAEDCEHLMTQHILGWRAWLSALS